MNASAASRRDAVYLKRSAPNVWVWRWTDEGGTDLEFRGFVEWCFEGDKIAERWATVTNPQPVR
jgi:hypothetical protein